MSLESKTLLTQAKNRIALHERNTVVRKKIRGMVQHTLFSTVYVASEYIAKSALIHVACA